jgi:cell division protein FtsZ
MAVELRPRIVVIGVGGAGGNAVNNMIEARLQGVEFVAANTDAQALVRSKAPLQIQLGVARTAGLGAGANPDVGAEAAKESADEIKKLLTGAHMCFIAAGMGGGTGTGAAPIIARIAKEQKVLTVGVVTKPFDFEGKRRMQVAEKGIVELRGEVDTLIIIPNQNLFRVANRETTFAEAFHMADRVLYSGVRGITDLMVMPGLINLDFADVRTVMAGMGTAMMGTGEGEGENRALKAAQSAIANPLLDDVSMKGAKGVLINITGGYDMTLFEVDEAANEVRREVDVDAHIILGSTFDENMAGKIRVSVVAAGVAQAPVARTAPQPVRELQSGLTAAVLNAPSPAAELGLSHAQPQAAQPAPQPVRQQPAPIIRRPGPAPEPEEHVEAANDAAPHEPPAAEPQARSFASLFGWKSRPADEPAAPAPKPPVEDDSFDDELEIPAFLRRSANT